MKSLRTGSVGPGPVAGAGEVEMAGPGKYAMRVKPSDSGIAMEAAGSKEPKGMKTEREGE